MTTAPSAIDEVLIPAASRSSNKAFAITIFGSSGLLFLIEPITAKQLLPQFGGSAAVWATCLVFFQCVLLFGYGWSFLLARIQQTRWQLIIQSGLVIGSAVLLWGLPFFPPAKPIGSGNPSLDCLLSLLRSIGLPYFVLSTTTPLLQFWSSITRRIKLPYRLFAVSNTASLLALLAYPIEIERYLGLDTQLSVWRYAYLAFALLFTGTAVQVSRQLARTTGGPSMMSGQKTVSKEGNKKAWVALAGCSSVLLMAITNTLCQRIAPIPLLWIAPLAVYLVSFVLCFDREGLFKRRVYQVIAPFALTALVWLGAQPYVGLRTGIGVSLACLFVLCMFCHGQLAALKPDARNLTTFYLYVSLGGALGAIFVGLLAPAVFHDLLEFEIGIAFCLVLVLRFLFDYRAKLFLALTFLFCILAIRITAQSYTGSTTYLGRNFYGCVSVREYEDKVTDRIRQLIHGSVLHGAQIVTEGEKRHPLTYYSPISGIGFLLSNTTAPRRVGVVGLGAGTLAAYGEPGDDFCFYEINPLVVALAHSKFSYLRDSRAHISIHEGDARLLLEREPDQHFDVMVLDAFSGDSIPTHLLTKEAFACYLRHLNRNGVLAVHVSNSYLNLSPIIADLGAHFDLPAVLIHSGGDSKHYVSPADWILLTSQQQLVTRAQQMKNAKLLKVSGGRLWTDQYSNLLAVLK